MPRTTDTKQRLLTEAWEMVNETGWESLNLHRLADRLGIKTPSLYNHILSLDDLRDQLLLEAQRGLGEAFNEAADGRTGGEAIRALGHAYRDYILSNPGLLPALSRTTERMSDEIRRVGDQTLSDARQVLAPLGLEDSDAIHALRMLRSLVHGFVTLELADGFGLAEDREESFRWMLERYVRSLEVR